MNLLRNSALLFSLPLLLAVTPVGDPPTMNQAGALLRREKWEAAAEAFEEIVAAEPENATAWFQLAYARSANGELELAITANEKASAFPAVRASALYNIACCHSRLGDLEKGRVALERAIAGGFLDFDLMKVDGDLEALRAAGHVSMPTAHVYEDFKARNKVELQYTLLLPKDFDPERSYPTILAFSPGSGGPASTDWTVSELWSGVDAQSEWVVLCAIAPSRGWFTHPSHHALEDLLKHVKKQIHVEGDTFHMFGFAEGARPATTYSGMSKRYCQSLVVVSSSAWSSWDDDELRRWGDVPVHQFVGARDDFARGLAEHVQGVFEAADVESTLTEIEGEGLFVPSLRGSALLEAVSDARR